MSKVKKFFVDINSGTVQRHGVAVVPVALPGGEFDNMFAQGGFAGFGSRGAYVQQQESRHQQETKGAVKHI